MRNDIPKVLAIIPARGGSKGVPGKNLKELGGKPLIQYAIDTANQSVLLAHVVVSTDDEDIANYARSAGVEVVIRPKELATDKSSVVDSVWHVLDKLGYFWDGIVLLQPTSPLRTGSELDNVIRLLFRDDQTEGVVSVVEMYDQHPARMYRMGSEAELTPFLPNGETTRRQDLEPVYYRNGCFYAVQMAAFIRYKTLMPPRKRALLMEGYWLLNIDEPRDFLVGEVMVKEWENK
jgi:CMP-N-acetylneuraminic acid synthetase